MQIDPQTVPFEISRLGCIYLGDHSEAGSGDIESHAKQAKVIQRIITTPASADGALELLQSHAQAVITNRNRSVVFILRRQRNHDRRRLNGLLVAPCIDERIHAVVDEFSKALPLI